MCELTLDLRRRNTRRSVSNPSALNLPTLLFREDPVQSVRYTLGRLHESIVAEMGERNDIINHSDGSESSLEEPGDIPNDTTGMDLDSVEDCREEPLVQDACA